MNKTAQKCDGLLASMKTLFADEKPPVIAAVVIAYIGTSSIQVARAIRKLLDDMEQDDL